MDDHLRLSDIGYLNVPDKDRSKSPSPADSLASSATDISTLPITGKGGHRKDDFGLTTNLVFAIASAAIGSAFQHGYNTGVVNAPQRLVEAFINETYTRRFGKDPGSKTVTILFSVIVSIFCLGGMVGALLTAYFANKFGRKGGLLVNNIFIFIAAILMGFSHMAGSYEMIIIGRFFVGVNSGLNSGLGPMYLTEISPIHLRGAVGSIYQFVVTISILVSQILGMQEILGAEDRWPFLFAMIVVPALFMLATMPLCPESPKYLLINQEKEIKAQTVLTWLRGSPEVHDELDEMKAEYESLKMVPKVTFNEMIHNPLLRKLLIIAVVIMLSQQFSGINAVIFYSTNIFLTAGLTNEIAMYATLGMGAINVLMTAVSIMLVERAGRRTLHLTGLAGMWAITIILTVCMALQKVYTSLSYLSIICVIGFVVMFATGPGSIPWFLVSELFGQGARPLATSIAVLVNWSANFVVSLGFLPLANILESYVFLIFTALLLFFWIFTYRYVPETKNKTPEEIAAEFRQKSYETKSFT